ncbi:histone deacetylase complex subunit SAP130-like isoform X2 [Scleropages formosus]|uniref:histone deacetylase complex subunit SAP130-like isoform X2 n=1 Tax=Scleropages formosus TaxID=113540 RepID=UPI000878062A|nr:histone deacetylase complex subunit SAP130-like isoform X2 [Scleropages formosus]
MSGQQFPRTGGLSPGQTKLPADNTAQVPGPQPSTGTNEGSCDSDRSPQDPVALSGAGSVQVREEKQDAVVVRPYPQVQAQAHGQPLSVSQHLPLQPGSPIAVSSTSAHISQGVPLTLTETSVKFPSASKIPMASRLIAPAPASSQGLLTVSPKVPGHVTVESNVPSAPAIPVAAVCGQQGHHLMAANVQIIRSSTPALQMGSTTPPPHTFPSHLPRGAAAAAVMSSSKGPTVLRPASGPSTGANQPAVQHILHQPLQCRPANTTTSPTVLPTVVGPVSATRAPSPVITTAATHSLESVHGRSGLAVHPPPANVSVQRPPVSRDSNTRITLPSHPAVGVQKSQHSMAQKSIFSTVSPVAAATVAPILATNTAPCTSATGSVTHTQMSASTAVTMTMSSHSSHAATVTSSAIPVAKVVPQPIAHTSPRIQPDYPGERGNLIPISSHRSSPNSVTMEARSDNRQSVPVQFQYFLPTYPPSPYPLTHTYTPITSSVSTIRQYPVTPQAPSSALPAQAGVGVASTVHLNPMQLMTVDRIGLQSTQISTQGIQPAPIGAQSIQPAPLGAQGLHTPAPGSTQGIQQAPVSSQQPPQMDAKASAVVLAEGSTLVASSIGNTFSASQTAATVGQTHPLSNSGSATTVVSSPRPSILRKKPTSEGPTVRKNLILSQSSESTSPRVDSIVRSASGSPRPAGVKPKADIHGALTTASESEPSQAQELQPSASQAVSTLLTTAVPVAVLPALPSATAVNPPTPVSTANVDLPAEPLASSTVSCAIRTFPSDINVKQETEPVTALLPVTSVTPTASTVFNPSGGSLCAATGDAIQGASPRKKPRKQQHVISTEESEMMEADSTDEEKAPVKPLCSRAEKRKSPPKEYYDEEGVRYVPVRPRPPVTLLRHYRNPWKAAYHHFQRYGDVRVKEEKKGTLQDMANQRGVVCRAQGWKIHLCAAQLLQLRSLEHDVYSRLTSLQEGLIPKKRAGADDDLHNISELIQGNMQRCKLVMDQVSEARDIMMKVLDHKERVIKLLNKNDGDKNTSKQKRKERT